MKACPECAESVQDAARKCRYCGYRFAPEPDAAAPAASATAATAQRVAAAPAPAAVAAPKAPAAASSNGPYLWIAAGGVLLAIGGLIMVVVNAVDFTYIGVAPDAFILSGLALALGWGMLFRRGQASVWPLLGGLALVVCWIVGIYFLSSDEAYLGAIGAGIVGNVGLALCAFSCLEALELELMEGARLTAMLAAIGFVIASVASSRQLPELIEIIGIWVGTIGTVLFGVALAVSAGRRGMEPAASAG